MATRTYLVAYRSRSRSYHINKIIYTVEHLSSHNHVRLVGWIVRIRMFLHSTAITLLPFLIAMSSSMFDMFLLMIPPLKNDI